MREHSEKEIRKIADNGALNLMRLAGELPPEEMEQVLAVAIANFSGNLPCAYFDDLISGMGQPCDRQNCQCHVYGAALKKAFIAARKDHRDTMAIGGKING